MARDLEALALRLLIHDAARSSREGAPLCAEAKALLNYFDTFGVRLLDVTDSGDVAMTRVSLSKSLYAPLLGAFRGEA